MPAYGSANLAWPAAPNPIEIRQWYEEDARSVIANAIELAEGSVSDGDRPEVNSDVFYSAPVPTLVDLSKEAQMVVVGCSGMRWAAICPDRSVPGWFTTPTARQVCRN